MNYKEIIIIFLHTVLTIFVAFYALVTSKNKFDFYYILYIYILFISWTFYNGECVLSYYYKRMNNNNYQAGANIFELSDLDLTFLVGEYFNTFIFILLTILIISNLYIVINRNNYTVINGYDFTFVILLIYIIYLLLMKIYAPNLQLKPDFLFLQEIIKYILLISLFIFVNNRFKFIKL